MNKQIKQFIRDEDGNPIGVMVAKHVGRDSYGIGYSVTRPDSTDVYDEHLGFTIADNRAGSLRSNKKSAVGALDHTAHKDQLHAFVARSTKFFQGRKPLAATGEQVVV